MSYLNGMYYEVKGTGKKPIVFLHGIGSSHNMFTPQTDALSEDYMTIAVDLKGSGLSDSITGGSYAQAHMDSLLALLDHIGLSSASFVGVSYGGIITQKFALAYPEKVESMVLIDTYANTIPKTKEEYALFTLAGVVGVASWLPGSIASKLYTPFKRWDLAYQEMVSVSRQKRRGKETTVQLLEVFRMDLLEQLKTLSIPSLVMVGDYVQGIVRKSEEIVRHLPNSELLVVPDAVDPSNLCQPDFVNTAIAEFFGKLNTLSKTEKVAPN